MKHSPAPWRIGSYPFQAHIEAHNGQTVAKTYYAPWGNKNRQDANTRLIVASPKLLALNRKSLDYIDLIMAHAEELPTTIINGAISLGQELESLLGEIENG